MVVRFCSLLVVVLVASCGRTSRDPDGASTTGGKAGAGGTSTGATSGFGGFVPETCQGEEAPDWPIRLLADYELANELEQLEATPGPRARSTPSRLFTEDSDAEPLAAAFVASQSDLAYRVAKQLAGDPAKLQQRLGCNLANEKACRLALSDFVLRRLFRGLASAETEAELSALFDHGQTLGGDFASGIRAVLEVALQSPEFLYRFELGRPAADRGEPWREPTDLELASRLSFLFWDRGPDEELLRAGERGELSDPEGLAAQALRMLADPRAPAPVRRFYRELLGVAEPFRYAADGNPAFTPEVFALMRAALDELTSDATFNGAGDYRALFAPVSWLNGPLAAFYGDSNANGEAFGKVQRDPARYAGLLTTGAFLLNSGHSSNPTTRGYTLLKGLLCVEVPPEPGDVLAGIGNPPDGPFTTRQRVEAYTNNPICVSCHSQMDPIGFDFEHFDSTGRWRDTDEGLPIDASGSVMLEEGERDFDGAPGLAQALIGSEGTRGCYVTQWQRFAFGRTEAEAARCSHQDLREAFLASGENVQALMIALTQTESFRYRKSQEGQP